MLLSLRKDAGVPSGIMLGQAFAHGKQLTVGGDGVQGGGGHVAVCSAAAKVFAGARARCARDRTFGTTGGAVHGLTSAAAK
eukprot:COSAG06_NODE_50_length_28525_cov_88.227010_22_plen_81_part_00